MEKTTHLELNKPELTDYVNVEDLNENADIIDEAINENKERLATHLAERASLTKAGHVQLSDSVTSTSKVLAATPSSVKTAMDRANAAFTSANNGKVVVGNAIVGVDPNVVIPTDPTFNDLSRAIGQISTGYLSEIVPGDAYIYIDEEVVETWEGFYKTMKEVRVLVKGTVRVAFSMRSQNSGYPANGRIYINGSAVGIVRSTTSTQYVTFYEDFSVEKGDSLRLYMHSSSSMRVYNHHFGIGIDVPNIIQKVEVT